MLSNVVIILVAAVAVKVFISFLARKNRSPHRTTLTCFLDACCELFSYLRVGPWADPPTIQTSMKNAMKNTKLSDWGGKDNNFNFVTRYSRVREVGMAKSGAKLSPIGGYFTQQALDRRMECRLKLVDYFKRHPNLRDIKLKAPVFVIGFTRTGTTFLHEMLGLHEEVRFHYTWEQLDPIPGVDSDDIAVHTADRVERYNKNKPNFEMLFNYVISRQIQDIHRIGYDEPEECTIPCGLELPWSLSELALGPFAIDEVEDLGAGEAFVFYRRFLQLLEWQSEDRRNKDFTWMLKCPFHLPYLKELHSEFPEATVVWTHRDPADCIASACSLYQTLLCMGMEESTVDPVKLGQAVMHYTKRSLEMAEKTIAELGTKFKILHIRYADTIKNPKDTCRRVYEKAGLTFSDQYSNKLDKYLQDSAEQRRKVRERKQSKVVHTYCPEDYGLTGDQIREEFKDYISKYNLAGAADKK